MHCAVWAILQLVKVVTIETRSKCEVKVTVSVFKFHLNMGLKTAIQEMNASQWNKIWCVVTNYFRNYKLDDLVLECHWWLKIKV